MRILTSFRRALERTGVAGRILVAESSPLEPAYHLADQGFIAPPASSSDHAAFVADLCVQYGVRLVMPLSLEDLVSFCRGREGFSAAGARVVGCSHQVLQATHDCMRTGALLADHGIAVARLKPATEALRDPLPIWLRPRWGWSARGILVRDASTLRRRVRAEPSLVAQEYVEGRAFTVDVYAGLDGATQVAVPRQEIARRGDCITQARTVRHQEAVRVCQDVVRALGQCGGVVTVHCVVPPSGPVRVMWVLPMIGNGAALSMGAGADFALWLVEEFLGRKSDIRPGAWQDGLVMLRYDDAVFCRAADIPEPYSDFEGRLGRFAF